MKSGIIKMLQTVTNSFQQDCNVFFIYHQNAICIDFCNKQVVSTVNISHVYSRYSLSAHSLMIENKRFTQLPKGQRLNMYFLSFGC